jgi:cytochrome c553
MQQFLRIAACIVALVPTSAWAAAKPGWAFPVMDKNQPPVRDDGKPKTAPGSSRTYTRSQIDDPFNPPDWYPNMHPVMPQVVAHGVRPNVRACALCHLPTGTGHDESAYVAGLPAAYFIQQIADFKSGARKGSGTMTTIAKNISDKDAKAAADYFAALKPRQWVKVVETDTVPKTYVGAGNKRLRLPSGGTEPIGNRIIEIPENEQVVLNRDPRIGFIAYVPNGSVERGRQLVATGGGKTIPCGPCHGPDLRGMGDTPPLAGHTANYIVRQLYMFQSGERAGPQDPVMAQEVRNFDIDDMIAIAAYAASLKP